MYLHDYFDYSLFVLDSDHPLSDSDYITDFHDCGNITVDFHNCGNIRTVHPQELMCDILFHIGLKKVCDFHIKCNRNSLKLKKRR